MQIFIQYQKSRKKVFLILLVLFLIFFYRSLQNAIPDQMQVARGGQVTVGSHLPVTGTVRSEQGAVTAVSTKVCGSCRMECRLFGLVPLKEVQVQIVDPVKVIPCGSPAGICINLDGVLVAEIGEVQETDGIAKSPARHILKKGDYILAINEQEIKKKEELVMAVQRSGGKKLRLTLRRAGQKISCELQPVRSEGGTYQLGIWVRDDMAGIGTLTFVDQSGNYGALGHGINDMVSENLACMQSGILYQAEILSVIKGQRGTPGELVGSIRYAKSRELGKIVQNTRDGIYGRLTQIPDTLTQVAAVPVGYKQEIRNGEAELLTEEDGTRKTYKITITSVDMNTAQKNKSIRFTVTDQRLIAKTGGIVQGLSGSPILQDGKFIGAVTHVFVNDPKEGYGILSETMLDRVKTMQSSL